MYIEKLEIKGFGKFNNRIWKLSKGLNVIVGSNESGKTTLQWFIKAMLFGLKGGRSGKDGVPSPLKRFKPWEGNLYGGFLEYRLDDGRGYRIERNFDTGMVRAFDSQFNDITAEFCLGRDKGFCIAEKHLGLNEACFERTVFVRQLTSKPEEDGSGELISRLVNAAQTGDEDLSLKNACQALKEALKQHVGTGRTTTRPLDRVIGRMEELEARRQALVVQMDSSREVQKKLKDALEKKQQLKEKKALLIACRDAWVLKGEMLAYENKRVALVQMAEEAKAFEAQLNKASSRQPVMGRRKEADRVKVLRRIDRTQMLKNAAVGMATVLFAIALLGVLHILPDRSGWLLSGAFGAAVVCSVAGIWLMRRLKRLRAVFAEQEKQEAEFSSSMLEVLELNSSLKDTLNKASLLYGSKLADARQISEAAKGMSERQATTCKSLDRTIGTTRTLLAGWPEEESLQLALLFPRTQLEDGEAGKQVPEEREKDIQACIEGVEKELGEVNLQIREYETLLLGIDMDADALQQLEEELVELEEKKRKLEDTNESIQIALQILTESGMEIQRNYVPMLSSGMCRIISRISGGRYQDLRTDDKLAVKTTSPETGEVIPAEVLSGGTVDQIYLAFRIAMAELITSSGEKLPYILDEALAQYDDRRTLEAFKFLAELAEKGQVIFFTCKEREADIAQALCNGNLHLIRL